MNPRYRLIHHAPEAFWNKWSTEVSHGLVVRQKWHESSQNLRVGDLIIMCEASPIKANWSSRRGSSKQRRSNTFSNGGICVGSEEHSW